MFLSVWKPEFALALVVWGIIFSSSDLYGLGLVSLGLYYLYVSLALGELLKVSFGWEAASAIDLPNLADGIKGDMVWSSKFLVIFWNFVKVSKNLFDWESTLEIMSLPLLYFKLCGWVTLLLTNLAVGALVESKVLSSYSDALTSLNPNEVKVVLETPYL